MSNLQQTRELYKKLPQKTRDIIVSPELNEIIDKISKENSLDKKQQSAVAKVVVDFLMDINNKESIRATINTIGVDNSLGQKIFAEIDSKILNNLDNVHTEITHNSENEEDATVNEPSESQEQAPVIKQNTGVGQSFEQIILNQARAMQPARPTDESGRVKSYEVRDTKTENRDTSYEVRDTIKKEENPQHKVPDYRGSSDPYREPLG